MIDMMCQIRGCAGPNHSGVLVCERHMYDPDAPPMLVTCECLVPDVEPLWIYGAGAAQCRQCGSPIAGTLA